MRIAVVDTYYPAFVAEHYRRRPELRHAPYAEQLAALLSRSFGTSDAYSHYLDELGHEAVDLIVNCFELQAAWAREHGRGSVLRNAARLPTRLGIAARLRFLRDVARAQLAGFGAEVIYLQDLWFFQREELDAFRAEGRLVVGQIASRPPGPDILGGFDLITTSFPHFVTRFREAGIDAEYLRIAFDERVLERLRGAGVETAPAAERPHAVSFVGGLDPTVHGEGVKLLEGLVGRVPLELWGYGVSDGLRNYHRGEAWGLEMYEVLARSRISLNRHIDVAEGHANNMRLFEATGVGALLVTEAAPNLADLFVPAEEVVAYEGEDDLVEKLEHYLRNDDGRVAIAAAGQRRTLAEHTYRRLMVELAAMLEERVHR